VPNPIRTPKDELVTKIADARSRQLSDAASAARIPLLIALTWALLWAWAIYKVEFGYINIYRARYIGLNNYLNLPFHPNPSKKSSLSKRSSRESDHISKANLLVKICETDLGIPREVKAFGRRIEIDQEWYLNYCTRIIRGGLEFSDRRYHENRVVNFPGGFGAVDVSDLGILANLGLLLILAWGFYAARRERDAVSSFINFESGECGHWSPQRYHIIPADPLLNAQHLSVAYSSVANRFLFLFSDKSKPKIIVISLVLSIPFFVSSANLLSDLVDVTNTRFENSVSIIFTVELFLVAAVGLLTFRCAALAKDTSFLLYGWFLGVRDVWSKECWSESYANPSPLEVNSVDGKATPRKFGAPDRYSPSVDRPVMEPVRNSVEIHKRGRSSGSRRPR
jgi:hypothetical protein